MRSIRVLVIISAGLILGGFVSAIAKKPRTIPNGGWGGPHIQLSVANGSATIEYDCATGTIDGPLKIDRHGRFSLLGKHVREHGGPIRMGEDREGAAARYTGRINGQHMTLTVKLVDSKQEVGTFALTRGSAGRVFKCR